MVKNCFMVIILILTVLIASCAFNKGSIENVELLIPGNSFAAIHFQNADIFLTNIDEFIEHIGSIPIFGNMKTRDFISLFLGANNKGDIDWFNLEKSWACALIPGDVDTSEFLLQLYIPIIEPSENYNKVKDFFKELIPGRIDKYGDYMIITNKESVDNSDEYTLPAIDIVHSKLNTFSEGSVTCYINLPNIFSWFNVDSLMLKNTFSQMMNSNSSDTTPRETEFAMNNILKMIDTVMQLEEIYINLEIGSDGLRGKLLTSYIKNGEIADKLDNLTKMKGVKNYLKYISSSSLFSSVDTFDIENSLDYFKDNLSLFSAQLPVDQHKMDELLLQLENLWGEQGPFTMTAFDLEIDLSSLSQFIFPGEEKSISSTNTSIPYIFRSIMNNFYFYIENIIDVKNKEQFRQELENIITLSLPGVLFEPIEEETGLSISLQYNKDMRDEDFIYDEIGISIEADNFKPDLDDSEDPETVIEVLRIIKDYIEAIKMQLHYTNDRCYIMTGKNSLSLLKEMVKKDAFPGDTLFNSSLFKHLESQIPDKIYSLGHFSISSMLSYWRNIPEFNHILTEIVQKPGIIWYSRYIKNTAEFTLFWDIEEISVLIDIIKNIMPFLTDNDETEVAMR